MLPHLGVLPVGPSGSVPVLTEPGRPMEVSVASSMKRDTCVVVGSEGHAGSGPVVNLYRPPFAACSAALTAEPLSVGVIFVCHDVTSHHRITNMRRLRF